MLCSIPPSAAGEANTGAAVASKQPCRLCYYDSDDTVPIFSETGLAADYVGKIARHLYLRVRSGDHLPQVVCWMCTQYLTQFDQFYAKINHIQRTRLKDEYEALVIYEGRDRVAAKTTVDTSTTTTEPPAAPAATLEVSVEQPVDRSAVADSPVARNDAVVQSSSRRATRQSVRHCDSPAKTALVSKLEAVDGPNDEDDTPKSDQDGFEVVSSVKKTKKRKETIQKTAVKLERSADEDADDEAGIPLAQLMHVTPAELPKQPRVREPATTTRTESTANGATERKRGRGRPPKVVDAKPSPVKRPKPTKRAVQVPPEEESSASEQLDDEAGSESEGESDDDFPSNEAREMIKSEEERLDDLEADETDENGCLLDENGDTDWAAMMASGMYPTEMLRDGLLLYKGERLMRIINSFYNLSCELCPPTFELYNARAEQLRPQYPRFRTLRALFDHYDSEHERRGHVRCCETTLSRYPAIIMHMARHLQPDAFRCETCGYVVTRPRFLEAHRQTHLPDAEKPFGCAHCERRFCWKRALQLHERKHTAGAAERPRYVCQECGKTYSSSGALCAHRRWTHGQHKQELGVCHICAKSFATRAGLNEHMELHRPRERTQVQCAECGKWLMNRRCLKSHMVLHTTAELRCDQCAYTTKKPVLMRRHLINRHTDATPFACTLCDKRFKMKRPLTVHMAEAHAAAGTKRKFACPFCGQQFNSSTNFYTHRKNRHPAELAAMRAEEAEVRRRRRIAAGVEPVVAEASADGEEGDSGAEEDEYVIQLSDLDGEPVLVKLNANGGAAEGSDGGDDDDDVDNGSIMIELIEAGEEEPDAS